MENLKQVFSLLEKKHITLRKIHDIRWLSRLEAVEAVVNSYNALVIYFDDLSSTDVVAQGLAKHLKSYRFVVTLYFLLDVLSTLGQLNKTFQLLCYHPCDAHQKVTEVSEALTSRYLQKDYRWGLKAGEYLQRIHSGMLDILDDGEQIQRKLQKDCISFVQAITDNLSARFPHNQSS